MAVSGKNKDLACWGGFLFFVFFLFSVLVERSILIDWAHIVPFILVDAASFLGINADKHSIGLKRDGVT